MQIQRDAFLNCLVSTARLIQISELFSSQHIKIVASKDSVRSYCANDEISACAYVPCDNPVPGTYYFSRAALEAFATKFTSDVVNIEHHDNRNILRAEQRSLEFLDPKKPYAFPRKPKSELENLDTLSESDALTIQAVAQTAGGARVGSEYHCVYARPIEQGTEIYAYNGVALSMGILDKRFRRPVALPVPLSRMAKFGNLLVSASEVGIEGPYCLYWCSAPVHAQRNFPLEKVQRTLAKSADKLFEIDGKEMTAAVDLLQRAFSTYEQASDAFLVLKGDTLRVRVRFPATKFEEVLQVRGSGNQALLQLPLKEHAKLLPILAKQQTLSVYNVGRHVRFESEAFQLLLPLETTKK